jgi:hypothetical protein
VFGATGAVWGIDPYGGPTRPGGRWPERELWKGEVGFSLIYRPGVPDASHVLMFSIAQVLERDGNYKISVSTSRTLDLIRPFAR